MIKISGPMNPTVFQSPVSDKWYACAGGEWLEVPADTQLSDLDWVDDWKKEGALIDPEINRCHRTTVKGSKGNEYKVEVWTDGKTNCECTGFAYRRTCKHVEAVKAERNVD